MLRGVRTDINNKIYRDKALYDIDSHLPFDEAQHQETMEFLMNSWIKQGSLRDEPFNITTPHLI